MKQDSQGSIIARNQQTYDALADEYEDKVSDRQKFNEDVVKRFINYIKTGEKVLDVGCAVGLDAAIFIENGYEVTGIELSPEMVKHAKKRNPKASIITGDFLETPIDNHSFDALYAQSFIHLFPKEQAVQVINKMHKALKKDGVAHVTTSKSPVSKEGWYEKLDYNGRHERFRKFWTKDELTKALEATGFTTEDYYEITDPFGKTWMVFTARA